MKRTHESVMEPAISAAHRSLSHGRKKIVKEMEGNIWQVMSEDYFKEKSMVIKKLTHDGVVKTNNAGQVNFLLEYTGKKKSERHRQARKIFLRGS